MTHEITPPWTLTQNPRTIKVTHKNATAMKDLDSPEMDRPLRERRLNVYRRELQLGRFRPVSWAKAYCEETNSWYRVNGQHTSTLFAQIDIPEYNKQFPPGLLAVTEEYTCPTLEDVSRLWSTYDSQTQSRNAREVNRAFVASIADIAKHASNTRFTNLAVGGMCFHHSPQTVGVIGTLADRAEQLFDNIEEYKWLLTMLTGKGNSNAKILQRVPIVATMIGTFKKSRRAAQEFWTAVKDATGTTPNLPDRTLNRWLLESSIITGRNLKNKRTPKEFYIRALNAWNAWRQKQPTVKRYSTVTKIPTIK